MGEGLGKLQAALKNDSSRVAPLTRRSPPLLLVTPAIRQRSASHKLAAVPSACLRVICGKVRTRKHGLG